MSLIGLGSPVPMVLPHPDGKIGVLDRYMLRRLYILILAWGSKTFQSFTGRAISDFTGKDFQSDTTTYMRKIK